MQDKYNTYVKELLKTLTKIEFLIEDNNQNIKDCISIMRDINKNIMPKPKSRIVNFFYGFFRGRRQHM